MNYTIKSMHYKEKCEKINKFTILLLTDETRLNYIDPALAKSRAGRRKLKIEKANSSTPVLTRAFFVRSVYAPIQNNLSFDRLFSMVARNGQPLAVGCYPFQAVFLPRYALPPVVGKLAVTFKNYEKDTAEMIYKFLCVNRTKPHFNLCIQSIHANNEESARLSLNADFRYLATVAKINPKFDRTLAMKGGIYA